MSKARRILRIITPTKIGAQAALRHWTKLAWIPAFAGMIVVLGGCADEKPFEEEIVKYLANQADHEGENDKLKKACSNPGAGTDLEPLDNPLIPIGYGRIRASNLMSAMGYKFIDPQLSHPFVRTDLTCGAEGQTSFITGSYCKFVEIEGKKYIQIKRAQFGEFQLNGKCIRGGLVENEDVGVFTLPTGLHHQDQD